MTDDILKKLDYLDDTKQLIRKAIEAKGPTITDEDPLRSYADKINNIESLDPNSAKIFKTEEEMNQDEKVFIGKKAIIYNRDMMPLNREITITNIEIPESFTLSKACDNNYYAYYYGSNIDGQSRIQIELNAEYVSLYIEIYTNTDSKFLQGNWQSEDGITYKNIDINYSSSIETGFGILEFSIPTTYRSGTWSDLIGEIFKANQSEFYGLYEYTDQYEDINYVNTFTNFTFNEDGTVAYDKSNLNIEDIKTKLKTILQNSETPLSHYYSGVAMITEWENDVPKTLELYHSSYIFLGRDQSLNPRTEIILTTYNSGPTSTPTYDKLVVNLIDMTFKEETGTTIVRTEFVGEKTYAVAVMNTYDNITPCFRFYIDTLGNDIRVNTFSYRYWLNNEDYSIIDWGYEYSIYYKRPRYMTAPTQLSNLAKNRIFENEIVYAQNGIVEGDKSYLTNIKTNDFVDTWLPGLTYKSAYTNVLQSGKPVSYQSFVERNLISYLNTMDQNEDDSVTEFISKLNEKIITLSESDTLYKVFKSYSYYTRTTRYNNKVYWYALGVNWSNTTSYQQVTSVNGVVYDAETMERVHEFTDTTTWQPINTGTTPNERYCGINFIRYIPERNEFIILFDTANWGWTNGAWAAIYRYNVVTKGRSVQQSINAGKHGSGTYYNLAESTYDITTNCFYCMVSGFDTNGANTKTQYIVRIDSSANVAVAYNDTSVTSLTSTSGSFWLQYQDRGPLFNYYQSADKTTKFVNLSNSKVLTIQNYTNSFVNETFVKHEDNYYILYKTNVDNVYTLYVDKINLDTMTKTNIVTWITNNNFSFYYVNKELCLYDYQNCKLYNFDKEYLFATKISDNTLQRGISGLIINNGDVETEAAYFTVATGNMTLTSYRRLLNYYVYKDITSYPIIGELFITGRPTYATTKDTYINKYESCQLTQLKVTDKQYQQYLDSMDQLLYEEEVEN